jgi:hypothetical protein
MPDPKVTSLRMPDTMTAELVAIAHTRNISFADALREALEEYITARRNDQGFKERLKKVLEEDGEVLDSLGDD